jgi:hypothetical protein
MLEFWEAANPHATLCVFPKIFFGHFFILHRTALVGGM